MEVKKAKVRFNYQDYCLMPEDRRYEIIDGEMHVVPGPSFRHQDFLLNLAIMLRGYVTRNNLGVVVVAPFDVILSQEDVVQPDLVYVSQERRDIITQRGCEGPPDLVVEIHSPSTAQRDKELKRKLYATYGVREYWLVDPDSATVEVLSLEEAGYKATGVYSSDEAVTSAVLPGFVPRISEVFQPS